MRGKQQRPHDATIADKIITIALPPEERQVLLGWRALADPPAEVSGKAHRRQAQLRAISPPAP